MKKKTKALMLVLCAVLLVTASVLGTMAYLTSTDEVVNTFTVGKVAITLDEAKVNPDGTAVTPAERVKGNAYHLLPGHTYKKDPTVHVEANSENSWIFVKVDNPIADIEADTKIAAQITEKEWTPLAGETGVYYKEYTTSQTVQNFVVFDNFKIKGNITNDELKAYNNKTVTVTAYAIQKDGFDTPAAAWAEVRK